jgi:hypothetical protein
VSGKVSFTLTTAGPGAAAPATAAPTAAAAPAPAPAAAPATTAVDPQADSRSSEGAPIWPWLVGAVILVAAGAAVALRLSRRS